MIHRTIYDQTLNTALKRYSRLSDGFYKLNQLNHGGSLQSFLCGEVL